MVGTDKRIALVAEDLVKHWEARYAAMEGKAMVVCMSRRICVELHKAIQKLRPDWHHDDDDKGTMKIVMSGSASDKLEWQQHIRNKSRREELAKAFKNPQKPFRIVIVRDMWLTGFDAPSLHTMYGRHPVAANGAGLEGAPATGTRARAQCAQGHRKWHLRPMSPLQRANRDRAPRSTAGRGGLREMRGTDTAMMEKSND
jgi:hypothetical protein